jgi:penicillin-binding protein 1A
VLEQPVVDRVIDHGNGNGKPAERVLSAPVAYIMQSILKDVVRQGTATKAKKLGREDLGGKTGTTNDQMDAWFTGFNAHLVATAWVGFDQLKPLGKREVGGVAALPMWMYFMETALDGVPESESVRPEGVVALRIDRKTGRRAASGGGDGTMVELFVADNPPEGSTVAGSATSSGSGGATQASEESLF